MEQFENSNKFVTITFSKKDGTLRRINGRFGVKKYLKGGKATLDRSKFMIIYSVQDRGYRAINRDSIVQVLANKQLTNYR